MKRGIVRPCYASERKAGLAFLLFVALINSVGGQSVSAVIKADSNHIQIGDHLRFVLEVKHSKDVQVRMPVVKDTLGNMEVIEVGKTDTTQSGNTISLSQSIIASAYDSGTYNAGPVMVTFTSGGVPDTLLSNYVPISVNTLDVDTAKPFKPIKAPLKVPYTWKEFIYYIIAGVWLIGLAIALYLMYRQQKLKKPAVLTRPVPKDPPHIWAQKELKKLEEEKLWQQGEIKPYYSRLSEILRLYLEYRYRWFALEETTEEIEAVLKKYVTKTKPGEMLLEVLHTADLVKFAKVQPMPDANMKCMESAQKFVEWTKPAEEKSADKKTQS